MISVNVTHFQFVERSYLQAGGSFAPVNLVCLTVEAISSLQELLYTTHRAFIAAVCRHRRRRRRLGHKSIVCGCCFYRKQRRRRAVAAVPQLTKCVVSCGGQQEQRVSRSCTRGRR